MKQSRICPFMMIVLEQLKCRKMSLAAVKISTTPGTNKEKNCNVNTSNNILGMWDNT